MIVFGQAFFKCKEIDATSLRQSMLDKKVGYVFGQAFLKCLANKKVG